MKEPFCAATNNTECPRIIFGYLASLSWIFFNILYIKVVLWEIIMFGWPRSIDAPQINMLKARKLFGGDNTTREHKLKRDECNQWKYE